MSTQPCTQPAAAAGGTRALSRRMLAVFVLVGTALTVVITAPVLLSSQDLYRWACDPHGLGLPTGWAWLVPVALDCAATAMIGMTVVCAWRRERPGLFEALVWVFAGVSAYAQYLHGVDSRQTGGARDAWWAFPAFAVLGPVLLHVVLARLRRWARQDAGEQARGAAGFGVMWLPGVAFRQTLRAWAASRREQIPTVDAAVAYVREVTALRGLSHVDAVRYALGALDAGANLHDARVWLQARGVAVGQGAIDTVRASPLAPPRSSTGAPRPAPPLPAIEAPQPAPRPSRRGSPLASPQAPTVVAEARRQRPRATQIEVAAATGLSRRTVQRHWPTTTPDPVRANGHHGGAPTITVRRLTDDDGADISDN